ncbi:ACP S-malonyltransferase [Terrihalobacillus insolitus]|uniref:ACP S-malonyltransferase n=1 Tax=Terrihalobacillus insolitus TaxID=2950438 RepID=UPI002341654F|nr:ACP S-malonyltransferase [Terrihalobacillus insolitus]MDC3412910.1 ACP S-malonyltransferase [Terrihalobacillus insolitus]
MKRVAFVFPGQGSQEVGMGKQLYNTYDHIRERFDRANDLLGFSITELMFNGQKEELTKTENAQPALLLTSSLINQLLYEAGIKPVVTAGHSLGEYSALVASGSLQLEEAIPLVQKRGQLMEEAYPAGRGAMAAILGLNEETIQSALEDLNDTNEVVDIANINCPGQIVISGTKAGIDQATEVLKNKGAKRILPLNVSGPFHSRLMKPASNELAKALAEISLTDAEIPVFANVTAQAVTQKEEIKELLIKQLYAPVRFEEIIQHILEKDVDAIVEVGNGKVLSGLVKKVNRRMKTFAVQDQESIQTFIDWYKEES